MHSGKSLAKHIFNSAYSSYRIFEHYLFLPFRHPIKNFFWRLSNPNNFTTVSVSTPRNLIACGTGSYGTIDAQSYGDQGEGLVIGKFVSIATNVRFILGGNHSVDSISPYPFSAFSPNKKERCSASYSNGTINVGDHVWIGHSSIILSGVNIGEHSIIGASSVVVNDIPPFSIAVGSPARAIKRKLLTAEQISQLQHLAQYDHLYIDPANVFIQFMSSKVAIARIR